MCIAQILIKGRHVCMGYLGSQLETKHLVDSQGWLRTGDIGRFDDDGFLQLNGRLEGLTALLIY